MTFSRTLNMLMAVGLIVSAAYAQIPKAKAADSIDIVQKQVEAYNSHDLEAFARRQLEIP